MIGILNLGLKTCWSLQWIGSTSYSLNMADLSLLLARIVGLAVLGSPNTPINKNMCKFGSCSSCQKSLLNEFDVSNSVVWMAEWAEIKKIHITQLLRSLCNMVVNPHSYSIVYESLMSLFQKPTIFLLCGYPLKVEKHLSTRRYNELRGITIKDSITYIQSLRPPYMPL